MYKLDTYVQQTPFFTLEDAIRTYKYLIKYIIHVTLKLFDRFFFNLFRRQFKKKIVLELQMRLWQWSWIYWISLNLMLFFSMNVKLLIVMMSKNKVYCIYLKIVCQPDICMHFEKLCFFLNRLTQRVIQILAITWCLSIQYKLLKNRIWCFSRFLPKICKLDSF